MKMQMNELNNIIKRIVQKEKQEQIQEQKEKQKQEQKQEQKEKQKQEQKEKQKEKQNQEQKEKQNQEQKEKQQNFNGKEPRLQQEYSKIRCTECGNSDKNYFCRGTYICMVCMV